MVRDDGLVIQLFPIQIYIILSILRCESGITAVKGKVRQETGYRIVLRDAGLSFNPMTHAARHGWATASHERKGASFGVQRRNGAYVRAHDPYLSGTPGNSAIDTANGKITVALNKCVSTQETMLIIKYLALRWIPRQVCRNVT